MSADKFGSPNVAVQLLATERDVCEEVLATPSIPFKKHPNVFFPVPSLNLEPIVLPKGERGDVFGKDGWQVLGESVVSMLTRHADQVHDVDISDLNTAAQVGENERAVFKALGVSSMRELIEGADARMVSIELWRGQGGEEGGLYRVCATHRFTSNGQPFFRELVKPVAELPCDTTVEALGAAIDVAFVESGRPIRTERP